MSEILDLRALDLDSSPPAAGEQRRFNTIVERLPVIVWMADVGGTATYFNGRWFEYTGLSRASSFERGWEAALHPEDLEATRRRWAGAVESRSPFEAECRLRGHDGHYRWFLVKAEPLFDPRGEGAQWIATCTDIEQQRGAEEARLREAEDRFRSSVEGLIDCFGLYTAIRDEAGRIVDFRVDDVNQSACDDLAISRELHVGTRLRDHSRWRGESTLYAAFCRVVDGGEPYHCDALELEVGEGEERSRRTFEIRATKLGDGLVAAWRDVTDRKRTERAIQESEERFRSLFATMSEGFLLGEVLCDERGEPVDFLFNEINPAFEKQSGLGRERVIGRRVKEVLPGLEDHWIRQYGRVALTGEPIHFTSYSKELDSHFQVVAFRPAPGRFAALFLNVNEQIRTRQALEETSRRLQAVLDVLPLPLFITDADGRVLATNPAANAFWGDAPLSEGPGSYREDYKAWWPGTGRRVESHEYGMARALATGEPVLGEEMEIETATGDRRVIHNYAMPIRDASGRTTGGVCVNVDVTALRRSEALFRKLAEANLVGVGFGQADGRILYVNDEMLRLMGRSREDFEAGRINWVEVIAPEFDEVNRSAGRELLATGRSLGHRQAFLRPDGGRTPFLGAAALMDDGRTRVSLAVDLTAIERAEEALREADRRKDEFLAMLAHELRNPLAAVTSAVHLLEMTGVSDNQLAASRIIQRQSRQLARLVDDLMDISRISSGKIQLNKEPVDAIPAIRRAIEACQAAIERKRHAFTASVPRHPVEVLADPARLEQMTVNLIFNAAKYTEAGGEISLTAAVEGDALAVRVRDNGVGIVPEMQERIFEPFTQVDSSLARSQGGLGLGLALVKRLVELHGGTVAVASEGTGKGSEFTLRLPLLTAAAAPPSARPPADPPSTPDEPEISASLRILVVDDNRDMAQSTAILLRINGYHVSIVHDGEAALDAARSLLPDVVLLDLGLPGMSGYEVAEQLRAEPAFRDTVLIVVSGYAQEQDRARSHASGIDHHLAKPVEFHQLHELLAQIQRRRDPA